MRDHPLAFAALLLAATSAACSPPASGSDDAATDARADGGSAPTDSAAPGHDAATSDAASPTDGGFVPAQHAPLPQIPSRGGPVLRRPHLVLVTFEGDPHASHAAEVARWMPGSSWLRDAAGEYGVEAGTFVQHAVLSTALPNTIRESDLSSVLETAMNAGEIPTPSANEDSLYIVLVPDAVSLITVAGQHACGQAPGYHGELTIGGASVAFGAIKVCPMLTGRSEQASLEMTLATVTLQTILNPYLRTRPAYALETPWDSAWGAMRGNELAGWCSGVTTLQGEGYLMPAIWSNAAAAASRHPCVPNAGATYFTVTPPSNGPIMVPRGGRVTVPLAAWSSARSSAWTLSTNTVTTLRPMIELDTERVNNGDVAELTVTMPASASIGDEAWVYVFSQRSQTERFWTPLLIRAE